MFNMYQSIEKLEELDPQQKVSLYLDSIQSPDEEKEEPLEREQNILSEGDEDEDVYKYYEDDDDDVKDFDVKTLSFDDRLAVLRRQKAGSKSLVLMHLTDTVEELSPAQISHAMAALLPLIETMDWYRDGCRNDAFKALAPKLGQAQAVETMDWLLDLINETPVDEEEDFIPHPFMVAAAHLYAFSDHVVFSSAAQRTALCDHISANFDRYGYSLDQDVYIKALHKFMEENINDEVVSFIPDLTTKLCDRIEFESSNRPYSFERLPNMFSFWRQTLCYLDKDQAQEILDQVEVYLEDNNHPLKADVLAELKEYIEQKNKPRLK